MLCSLLKVNPIKFEFKSYAKPTSTWCANKNLFQPFRMRKIKIFELIFTVQIYIGKRQYILAWPMRSRYPIKSIYQWRGMMNNDSLHWLFTLLQRSSVPFPSKIASLIWTCFFFQKSKLDIQTSVNHYCWLSSFHFVEYES